MKNSEKQAFADAGMDGLTKRVFYGSCSSPSFSS